MKKLLFLLLIVTLASYLLVGCNPVTPPAEGEGTLKLYLTDAPGDYLAVDILISRIDAHIAEAEQEQAQEGSLNFQNRDSNNTEEDIGGEWVTLINWGNGLPVDLIELEGQTMLLSTNELEAGTYTQLRVFLMGEASITIEGEEEPEITENLIIPSSAQTGIKLTHPFEIIEGQTTELTLDFDAQESIFINGNGEYMMQPTIKVISESSSS
ncbi:MAG: DUF4382 domain-containing protein [Candidatus Atribacteria bacterium]|nr:DUF4382 domain-containing protein [Candidatus Atribacteria bacterium]